MGLFSFVKNAGAKLFGRKAAAAPETNVAESNAPILGPEELDNMKADELISLVQNLELKIDSLYVAVEGDKATIAGVAADLAEKEKAILACGNVEGIAMVDDQLKVIAPAEVEEDVLEEEPKATFYTVKKGDSLSKIAKAHYGDPMKYHDIFHANQPMLSDPDKIYAGQVLRIP